MKIGVTIHATDLAMDVPELAREAEARGFFSLYVPEHTHIPVSRRTPPPTGDAELAEEYKRSPDPLVVLAAAAALTKRIRLGTGIGAARRSTTRSAWPSRSRRSTGSPAGASSTASATAGTSRRWRITASTRSAAARACAR